MNLGILISSFELQKPHFTTFFIAREALSRGHTVFICQYADLRVDIHGLIRCRVASVPDSKNSYREYFDALVESYKRDENIALSTLDIFWVRTDWIELAGIGHSFGPQMVVQFAQVLKAEGVRVIPDIKGLGAGDGKLYLDQFPEEIRPPAITTRSHQDIKLFAREVGGTIVLKPAISDRGRNVFIYKLSEPENANQIFETLAGIGFIYAQKFVYDSKFRSTRIFLFNGSPLYYLEKYASVMLTSINGDFRSNAANGGTPVPASLSDEMIKAAQIIAPKLKEDGFFLSAIDMVASKVIEVNQMNVGGMRSTQRFQAVNFTENIIYTLENELSDTKN